MHDPPLVPSRPQARGPPFVERPTFARATNASGCRLPPGPTAARGRARARARARATLGNDRTELRSARAACFATPTRSPPRQVPRARGALSGTRADDVPATIAVNDHDRSSVCVVPAHQLITIGRIRRADRRSRGNATGHLAVRVERLKEEVPGAVFGRCYWWSLCRRHESIISSALALIWPIA